MGYMTLSDFRIDLQSALGDRGLHDPRLDRFINFGYLDLCGAVDFEVLEAQDVSQSTAIGNQNLNVPANAMLVRIVRDTTVGRLLGWIPKVEFYRRAFTPNAAPLNWTRDGAVIKLNPTPNAVDAMLIIYKKTPVLLAATTDVSVIPDIWDPAIFLLSVHHALLALGEEQRSTTWLARAISYIQSRMTENDLHENASGLGASIPIGMHKLMARLGGAGAEGA